MTAQEAATLLPQLNASLEALHKFTIDCDVMIDPGADAPPPPLSNGEEVANAIGAIARWVQYDADNSQKVEY